MNRLARGFGYLLAGATSILALLLVVFLIVLVARAIAAI